MSDVITERELTLGDADRLCVTAVDGQMFIERIIGGHVFSVDVPPEARLWLAAAIRQCERERVRS
jgi:hypothetical protein